MLQKRKVRYIGRVAFTCWNYGIEYAIHRPCGDESGATTSSRKILAEAYETVIEPVYTEDNTTVIGYCLWAKKECV